MALRRHLDTTGRLPDGALEVLHTVPYLLPADVLERCLRLAGRYPDYDALIAGIIAAGQTRNLERSGGRSILQQSDLKRRSGGRRRRQALPLHEQHGGE